MSYDLQLFDRPAQGYTFHGNITHLVPDWMHTSKALGGYYSASGTVTGLPPAEMKEAFQTWIGKRITERTFGLVSWAGYIHQLDLVTGGVNYRISLDEKWFHNKVRTIYRQPHAEDDQQGSVSYTTESGNDTLTDDGQDFSDWETTSGDALYKVEVLNSDGSRAWGFLGAKVSNTEIYVYTDVELSEHGWSGEYDGKTPSTYDIIACPESGADIAGSAETSWATNEDSVDQFYTREHIVTASEMPDWKAEDLRDIHLSEFAWPRSRMVGGVTIEAQRVDDTEDSLSMIVLGFWNTLGWTHCTTNITGTATSIIERAVSNSDFLTEGRIDQNDQPNKFNCNSIPMTWGEIVESVIESGDLDENIWQGGVYAGRKMRFEQAPTTVEYYLRGGQLVDKGGVPVIPSLLEPGFLLRNADAPTGYQPPGTSNVWDDPQVAYVDAVTFEAPNRLRLQFYGEEESVIALEQDIMRQQSTASSRVEWT
jgi:hypothetical protein